MISKHFNCVWQDLRQFQVANVAAVLSTILLTFILVLLELPEGLKGSCQAVSLLVDVVELMGEEK